MEVEDKGRQWGGFVKKLSTVVVALDTTQPSCQKTGRFFWCQPCLQCATMLQSSKNSRFLMQFYNTQLRAWTPLQTSLTTGVTFIYIGFYSSVFFKGENCAADNKFHFLSRLKYNFFADWSTLWKAIAGKSLRQIVSWRWGIWNI